MPTAFATVTDINPPKSRNDPCPCGSGKRYKACHGAAQVAPLSVIEPTPTSSVEALMYRALAAQQTNRLDEAAADYDSALALDPKQPDALHMRGVVALSQRDPHTALNFIERALAAGLDNQALRHNLSLAREGVAVLDALPDKVVAFERATLWQPDERSAFIPADDVGVLCYFLPQFHRIAENDAWWGLGFTEWTNVRKAQPNFAGHDQPRVPTTLGYYDLLDPSVRSRQADLARAHGITGFCYYHYWFRGKRILEQPLDAVLRSGDPDFPFCIFWANESWRRTWDGGQNEVLMQQQHDAEDDLAFIRHLLPIFADRRYIRVRNQPLLMVYRVDGLPDAAATFERWREACVRHGEMPPFIVVANTTYTGSPLRYGADASVGFPPHRLNRQWVADEATRPEANFRGTLLDYRKIAALLSNEAESDHLHYQCVVPRWDNTARRQHDGTTFVHASPERFEAWLRAALLRARRQLPAGQRLVFVNAWNEWAEGAYLEPDTHFGDRYLRAALQARYFDPGALW